MFYRNEFVGNWEDMIYGDITEAKSHLELESLIKKLQNNLDTFYAHDAPDMIKETHQKRLEEVLSYYMLMGGSVSSQVS
jgi:hypothetical protein